jgi:hypothetical protein
MSVGKQFSLVINLLSLNHRALLPTNGAEPMPCPKSTLALTTVFLLCLSVSPFIALAKDDKLDSLVKQLADREPETQIAACQELGVLGEEAAPAGAALVEAMLRAKGNMIVWQAAADALEKVAPKVQPHVRTIMLNYNSNDDKRYGGAIQLGKLGEEGAAGLPVLKVLWRETSKSYHGSLYAQFCTTLSVAPNDAEVSKLRQMVIFWQVGSPPGA